MSDEFSGLFNEVEYVDPDKDKCNQCGCSFGVHLKTCSKFRDPQEKCTCGPDYFDSFCSRHGSKSPDEKWKELNSRPEPATNDIGKSYRELKEKTIENGRINLADANVMPLDDSSVDLIVTDPPYGISFKSGGQLENRRTAGRPQGSKVRDKNYFDVIANDDVVPTEWLKEAFRVLRPNTGLYVFCHWKGWSTLYSAAALAGFVVKNMIVLNKSNHGMGDIKGSFAPKHELLLFAVKGRHVLRFPPRLKDVWDVPVKFSGAHHLHPNEKPLTWMTPAILASSDAGQIVLDPFCGSGSTLEAAKDSGRDFIGFDIDPQWVSVAQSRLYGPAGAAVAENCK